MLTLASEVPGWAEAVAATGIPTRLAPGERLLSSEDDDAFVMLSGEARLILSTGRSVSLVAPTLLGEMPWVLGSGRTGIVEAVTEVDGLRWPVEALASFAERSPAFVEVLSRLASARLRHDLVDRQLKRWIPHAAPELIADALRVGQWTRLEAGETLIHEGDASEHAWLMISGRLEVRTGERVITRVRPGETVGELGLITRQPRRATVRALRRTELLGFDRASFETLIATHPSLLRAVIGTLGDHLGPEMHDRGRMHLAIVVLTPSPRTEALLEDLVTTLRRGDDVTVLDRPPVHLTGLAPQRTQVAARLDELDATTELLVTVAGADTPWAELTTERADRIAVIVSDPEAEPDRLHTLSRAAPTTVVRIWPANTEQPSGSRSWLQHADAILHWRSGDRAHRDRIARTLTERSIGLVIAGGAARSVAAVGVARALEEVGVPIDRIGGTSMGAMLAAAMASEWSLDRIEAELHAVAAQARSLKRLTLPMISLVRSAPVEAMLRERFGTRDLSDLWLPIYAVSSDLTANAMAVHDRGDLVSVLLASSALPGLLEPAIVDGHVHVDGAMVDNMPVLPMRASTGFVITVDVMFPEALHLPEGQFPSPWQLLLRRATGAASEVPGILRILQRATLVASESEATRARQASDLVITPPIDDLDMLDFSVVDEVIKRSLELCRTRMRGWLEDHPALAAVAARPPLPSEPQ